MFSLENIHFLIVDDNPADQFFCIENLSDQGADEKKIETASSIAEMERLINTKNIDVVLLDLFLPDAYGTNTFNQVKNLLTEKVVIVMSGHSEKNVALEAVNQGAQDFLIKGEFDSENLAKSISYSIERKKSIQLLSKSERKYKLLFEISPLPLFLIKLNTLEIEMANKLACEFFSASNENIVGKNLHEFFINYTKNQMIRKLSSGNIDGEIFNYYDKNKSRIIQYYSNQFIEDNNLKAVVLYEDITESIIFKRERLKVIASIQDVERKKFAKEIHDGLGQQLVLANLYLNQLQSKSEHKSEIAEIKNIINTALDQSRSLTYNITPPLLEEGIIAALKSLFDRLQKLDNINVHFCQEDIDENEVSLNIKLDLAYNVYRITQEFINNTLKHAKAKNISCKVSQQEEGVVFQLLDDGVGFDTSKTSNGYGLRNFKERAEAFNIKIDLKSELNKGTELTFVIKSINDFSLGYNSEVEN